jgi:hypothetical protein
MPWLADTHAIALTTGRTPSTIRTWARRYPHLMPRRGTGKHHRALYDIEEAEHVAALLDHHGGNTRRTVQH